MTRDGMISLLFSMRAQIDTLLAELGADQANDCPHPKNERKSLSVMGGPEHWVCQLCGHEYVATTEGVTSGTSR